MRKTLRASKKKQRINDARIAKMKQQQQGKYTFENVFTLQHFIEVFPKCFKGVSWKSSVQNYDINIVTNMYNDFIKLQNGELPKPTSCKEVIIRERGKERVITPIHIRDRVVQKVLCDFALSKILHPKLIYDNGASLKGKGVQFARKRIERHLRNAIREFGTDFYVLSFDFKSYFNSVPHKTCRKVLSKYIYDKDIVRITMEIIKQPYRTRIMKIANKEERKKMLRMLDNDELCGMCLGSQVSQIMALIIANDLDHYIKDIAKCRYYERYMDDGDVFLKTKEELWDLLEGMKRITDDLGLKFNISKTHITKSSKGFTFLQVRYIVTDDGRVIKIPTRKSAIRMRRKLRKFALKLEKGEITLGNVYDSMQSWVSHLSKTNSYLTVRSMVKTYNNLYYNRMVGYKHGRINGGKH